MTTFKTGNMWDRFGEVDLFCLTINGTFNSNGELVMGKGIALLPDNVEVWEYEI